MHYAVPRLLHEAGRLESLYTDTCAVKGWPRALKIVPRFLWSARMRRLSARIPRGLPASRITAFAGLGQEYGRRLSKSKIPADVTAATLWAGQTFCRRVVSRGLGRATAVYAFNGAGLELLQRARHEGKRAVLEQTIAPKEIELDWLRPEREKFPEWEPTSERDSFLDAYIAREKEEWSAADLILCGSEFVRQGIARCGGPADRCRVVSHAVDASDFPAPARPPRRGPLRVLTVGAVGLRKGSPYVEAAAKRLRRRAYFRMVGPIDVPLGVEERLRQTLELTGAVPRSEIPAHYCWADVLLLPSLCEGSATVASEALACGLPVVTTLNAGTVVRHELEGFIVPPRNIEAVVQALTRLIETPELLRDLSRRAEARSRELNFSRYGENLISELLPFLE